MDNGAKSFNFGTVDYILFVLMLSISAGVGIYFGFISKLKNTTNEYLMGSKQMRPIPIAISLIASQLSGVSILLVPTEVYSYGVTYFCFVLPIILMVPILNYIIVPVFYNNNISNCYEYLELRFNKATRHVATAAFVLNGCLTLPVYMFVPSLAFSQVSGISTHLMNTIVCSICVFYTMLGGVKAVVWTDVVQAGIMISSVVLVGVFGTLKVGGLDKVLENASEGGRMDFNFSLDPRVRSTFWNLFCGGLLVWTGHIGLNQSCVQRIVSLPSLKQARKALILVGFGVLTIMGFTAFIGVVMFARYFGCDPILGGVVQKPDKMLPFFVQDVMGHMLGMPGIFISCVFSAALSTVSALFNSLAGVVYFDYIKPFIKHSDERANNIMKIFVVVMGVYCILGGLVVEQFKSIYQLQNTIQGINIGAVVGIFLVGMFVPRVNGKVAFISVAFSVVSMLFIITNAQMRFKAGYIRYEPLSTSLDRCENFNFNHLMQNSTSIPTPVTDEIPLVTTAFSSNRDFSIYEISFYWYKLLGTFLVFISAIPLSYIWKRDKEDYQNPKLYSPFVKKFLNLMFQINNAKNYSNIYTFGTVDYIVFILMLLISAGVGLYFGFFRKLRNTTQEYLMGNKQMKPIPIAISLIASQLSASVIMSVPGEIYSYGFTYIFYVLSIILMIPILNYIIIPVYYNNNVSTCYEYLEIRFNKLTRQLATAAYVLNACLTLPVYMFVPALAFSQVSGLNIHLINIVICTICVFYTMLGGIKAVVWTDVLQAAVMIFSIVLVGILGIIKVGGFNKVFVNATEGGRMDFNFLIDLRVRSTFWNQFFNGILVWVGHIGMNQTSVQRIMSIPKLQQARKALIIAGIGITFVMGFNCFIGLIMFARYFGCDPILAGIVAKADKLMPFFVQDVLGYISGMPGIFMSCVFSAALSTLSAMLNSLAGVVYFDYIKPFIKHSDEKANNIMKIFIIIMGVYCVLGGIIVQKFSSIIQTVNTIEGITSGAKAGIFLLGMFVPRANGKVACISIATSVGILIFIIVNAQIRLQAGYIKYKPLPTSLDRCEAYNFQSLLQNSNISLSQSANDNPFVTGGFNQPFNFYDISFYWYKLLGAAVIFISAIPLSYIWKCDKEDKMNYQLYSPFVKRFLKKPLMPTSEVGPL
ncbi:uncharacterized protein ACRADG_013305 [Cochliomyia hominivorax]